MTDKERIDYAVERIQAYVRRENHYEVVRALERKDLDIRADARLGRFWFRCYGVSRGGRTIVGLNDAPVILLDTHTPGVLLVEANDPQGEFNELLAALELALVMDDLASI